MMEYHADLAIIGSTKALRHLHPLGREQSYNLTEQW